MKILVTGAWNYTTEQINNLCNLGHSISTLKYEVDALPCEYEVIEGVICNSLFLYHPIEKFKNLKYIQLTSAGFDRVPIDYINKKKIVIYNASDIYSVPIAEYVVCGVLQLYKKSRFFMENQKLHKWEKSRNIFELLGKKVCRVGCGSIGTECATRFAAFGCEVIGIDLIPELKTGFKKIYNIYYLDEIIRRSDIIVLSLPLTDGTKNLFNENKFSQLKLGTILVNISRGEVVDTMSLETALRDKLLGAVLDVFDIEPLNRESPLWDMENVIITPHNSYVSEGNSIRLYNLLYKNLSSWRNGNE